MYFHDRREAGRLLAKELDSLRGDKNVIVLGIPRGGVVVAYEVAQALGAPLDIYITRKIGAPYNPELAIGAVAGDGTLILDRSLMAHVGASETYVQQETEEQRKEIARRLAAYRGKRPGLEVKDKVVVLVDDGVATGSTVLAALRALRQRQPKQLILAIPVAPADTVATLEKEADRVVCLHAPVTFWAVGAFYEVFEQTSDAEVVRLLSGA